METLEGMYRKARTILNNKFGTPVPEVKYQSPRYIQIKWVEHRKILAELFLDQGQLTISLKKYGEYLPEGEKMKIMETIASLTRELQEAGVFFSRSYGPYTVYTWDLQSRGALN